MREVQPLYDRMLVKRKPKPEESEGGIAYAAVSQEIPEPSEGTVMAVGQGRILETGELRPIVVKVGDVVLFGTYGGQKVAVDGEDLLILREDEIFAIVRGTDEDVNLKYLGEE